MLVLRTANIQEPYIRKKVPKKTAAAMEKAGLIENYDPEYGYIRGSFKYYYFEFRGKYYKVEYFSGCFHPFLLQLEAEPTRANYYIHKYKCWAR